MTESHCDLSGRWIGIFNYPALWPPGEFQAALRDVDGMITGETTETNDGAVLHALIDGHRNGSDLSFSKTYDDLERMPDVVLYCGTVAPDGNEIEGRWEIPGIWSGTFLMVRNTGARETIEEKIGETV